MYLYLFIIILSALHNRTRFFAFIAQVSLPYTNTLWTQASYLFLFSLKKTPIFVKMGSLNFPHADRTLIIIIIEISSALSWNTTDKTNSVFRIRLMKQISLQTRFINSQSFRLTDLDRKSVPSGRVGSAKSMLAICRRVSSRDEQIPSICRPMNG